MSCFRHSLLKFSTSFAPAILQQPLLGRRGWITRAAQKRSPSRGSQRLRRALGGTRILLAAAPTAPPCFCRRQRSSLLHRGFFTRRTIRRGLRVALAAFSAAPWQGFEKAERCPSLASLFPPQAAVGSAAVRIHPLYKFKLVAKQKPQRICIR